MEPGMFDYEEWLDEVSNKGLTDEQEECFNKSVECTVDNHPGCSRASCRCLCHIELNPHA